ncbi:MAG: ROK family protein, partial [Bdellovibrionales bacterium]|nr:ROK family protein [Bdellovibrionales bacterium]
QTIDRLISLFSKAVAVVINILDPDVIVLGGGVSNLDALYSETPAQIAKYAFNEGRLETKIAKHSLGDSAGVFGAAMLLS